MAERRNLLVIVTACLWAIPTVASANMGIPMIAVMYPGMLIMLIPVIVLETVVLRRRLGSSPRKTAIVVTVSNLVSTAVGVPISWSLLLMLQSITGGTTNYPLLPEFLGKLLNVTWQAPWMIPWDSEMWWMIPVAALVLLVPFFFMSWMVEYVVAIIMMRDFEPIELRRAVLAANLVSYALLVAVVLVGLGVSTYKHFGI